MHKWLNIIIFKEEICFLDFILKINAVVHLLLFFSLWGLIFLHVEVSACIIFVFLLFFFGFIGFICIL